MLNETYFLHDEHSSIEIQHTDINFSVQIKQVLQQINLNWDAGERFEISQLEGSETNSKLIIGENSPDLFREDFNEITRR